MNRRTMMSLGVVILAALPMLAQDGRVSPGGIRVHGFTNEFDQFYLDVTVAQGGADLFQIQAVKIYSEPSHTLLCALVDDVAPASLLTSVQEEKPLAMTTSPIGEGMTRIKIGAPPGGDSRVRVDYVVSLKGSSKSLTVAENSVSSLSNFEFSSELLAGKYKLCGYCSGLYCGCAICPTPFLTTCCPDCSVYCGIVTCP